MRAARRALAVWERVVSDTGISESPRDYILDRLMGSIEVYNVLIYIGITCCPCSLGVRGFKLHSGLEMGDSA